MNRKQFNLKQVQRGLCFFEKLGSESKLPPNTVIDSVHEINLQLGRSDLHVMINTKGVTIDNSVVVVAIVNDVRVAERYQLPLVLLSPKQYVRDILTDLYLLEVSGELRG